MRSVAKRNSERESSVREKGVQIDGTARWRGEEWRWEGRGETDVLPLLGTSKLGSPSESGVANGGEG